MRKDFRLAALLGPTNTGKTHYAMDRMASYGTGMIGFPLRLLARENYDKFIAIKGRHQVALITGEEKIIPLQPKYYICTVEAMPVSIPVDFLAVDEIQLCGDPERGHIFTDRLLHARGREETLFLGAETIRPLLQDFLPQCHIETRQRLSTLTYTGMRKISRLPRRSAIVAFNVNDVYHLGEQIRQQRGGTALVLGALSPRTRNAQVEMYQSGEVDYLVATDAIGMGLNMDIDHVALAASRKFDGARMRDLRADEVGQIAGRAGRFKRHGTFGTTGELTGLDPAISSAVENHVFAPLKTLRWRNSKLDFRSVPNLLKSLAEPPHDERLMAARIADDHRALHYLAKDKKIQDIASTPDRVRLLWDVCQIPDFRQTLTDSHPLFLSEIFQYLTDHDSLLPHDWITENIKRLDRTDGDIDTLLTRIAHIRTWTYVTHVQGWLGEHEAWQDRARRIEDKLSDALHDRLTQRFVDRRSHHLLRQMKNDGNVAYTIAGDGTVTVNGRALGILRGWFFMVDATIAQTDKQATIKAAQNLLQSQVQNALDNFAEQSKDYLSLNDDGAFVWQVKDTTDQLIIAQLKKTDSFYQPKIVLADSSFLNEAQQKNLDVALETWFKAHQDKVLQPLLALADLPAISGTARGIAFQVYEHNGVILRKNVQELVNTLAQEDRQALHNLGIKLGAYFIYHREMLKTAALKQRAILSRLKNGFSGEQTPLPAQGNVSVKLNGDAPRHFYFDLGFPVFLGATDPIAVRVDMVERVNSAVYDKAQNGIYTFDPALASTIGTSVDALQAVLHGLGFRYEDKTAEEAGAVAASVAPSDTTENSEVSAQPDQMVENTLAEPTDADKLANNEATAQPDAAAKMVRIYHLKKATPFFLRPPRDDNRRDEKKTYQGQNKPKRDDKPKAKQSPGQFNKKKSNPSAGNPRDNIVPVKSARPTGHQAFAGLADLQSLMAKKK
ncbi:MAG TPA: helicase-related protein [Alphaproteobacteria bacterium]